MFIRNMIATGGQRVSFSLTLPGILKAVVDGRIHNIFIKGMPESVLVDSGSFQKYLARSYVVVRESKESLFLHVLPRLLGGMEEAGRLGPRLNRQVLLDFTREALTEAEKANGKEVVVFMGDTGAGKSALISALSGVQMEQSGAVVKAAPGHIEVAPMQQRGDEGRSTTFMTKVYFKDARPQAEHHFVDCGGFGDTNLIPEKKFIVPLSAALTLRKAKTIRFILCMSWGALDHKQGKGLIKLMKTVYSSSKGSLITPEQSETISRQTLLLFTRTDGRVTTDEALRRANTIHTNKIAIWREGHGEEANLSLRCLKNIIDQGNVFAVDVLDVESMNGVKQAISRMPKIETLQSVFRLPQGEVSSILNDIMADVVRGKDLYTQLKKIKKQIPLIQSEKVNLQASSVDLDQKQKTFERQILSNMRSIEETERKLAVKGQERTVHAASAEEIRIHTIVYPTADINDRQLSSCPYYWEQVVISPICREGVNGGKTRSVDFYIKEKYFPYYQQRMMILNGEIAGYREEIQSLHTTNSTFRSILITERQQLSNQKQNFTRQEVANQRELNEVKYQLADEKKKFEFAYQFLSLVDDPGIRATYPVTREFITLYQAYANSL